MLIQGLFTAEHKLAQHLVVGISCTLVRLLSCRNLPHVY